MTRGIYWICVVLLASVLALTACGKQGEKLPPQRWRDVVFYVETRPSPMHKDRIEFIIIANHAKRGPVADLLVSIRVDDTQPWEQAIQDGFSGVYRKVLRVEQNQKELKMQVKQGEHQTQLVFILAQS